MVTSRVSSTSRIGALNKMKKMLVIICNTAQRVQNFVQNSLKNKKCTVHPRYKTPTGELKHCIDIDECSYGEACPRYLI